MSTALRSAESDHAPQFQERPRPATPPAPSRLRRFTDRLSASVWARCFALSITWQLFLTVVGRMMDSSIHPVPGQSILTGLLLHTQRWDALWFLGVIHNGYQANPSSVAFYPTFPALMSVLETITFGHVGLLVLGIVVNTVALAVALRGLLHIGAHFGLDAGGRRLIIVLLLASPAAIFFHMFYSESLFLALSVWAYVFALRGRYPLMALLLAGCTATRLTGVLAVALCAFQYAQDRQWDVRKIRWNILWLPAGLAGFAAYAVVCWSIYRDPLAMINNVRKSSDWTYHVFNPNIVETIANQSVLSAKAFLGIGDSTVNQDVLFLHFFPLVALLTLLASSLYLVIVERGATLPLALFGFLAVIMFSLNSNVISVHRYVVVCFSLFVACALAARRFPRFRPVLLAAAYGGALLQGWFLVVWVNNSILVS